MRGGLPNFANPAPSLERTWALGTAMATALAVAGLLATTWLQARVSDAALALREAQERAETRATAQRQQRELQATLEAQARMLDAAAAPWTSLRHYAWDEYLRELERLPVREFRLRRVLLDAEGSRVELQGQVDAPASLALAIEHLNGNNLHPSPWRVEQVQRSSSAELSSVVLVRGQKERSPQ